jgi:4-carboxymuconolactone decarboxylase
MKKPSTTSRTNCWCKREVSDATFHAAKETLGEKGIVDLVGAMGYFQFISMLMDVDRYPMPNGVKRELKPIE